MHIQRSTTCVFSAQVQINVKMLFFFGVASLTTKCFCFIHKVIVRLPLVCLQQNTSAVADSVNHWHYWHFIVLICIHFVYWTGDKHLFNPFVCLVCVEDNKADFDLTLDRSTFVLTISSLLF